MSKSSVGAAEQAAVAEVLTDGYLGMGRWVKDLEERLGEFFGRGVACVNSGTAALHLALLAVGIGPGDEVLVPSLTFVASFQAITAAGAVPVACDVHEDTATIDVRDAEQRLTARTRAIMPVHYASRTPHLDAIHALAQRHGLRVIEDAAHAFGCRRDGRRIGSWGDVACFSFDGIKNITCGEGGAVVSADSAVIDAVNDARLLGVAGDTRQRYTGGRSWEFDVRGQGFRYHMSNLNAAIGLTQLARFEAEFAPRRRALAQRYQRILSNIAGLALFESDFTEMVPHIYPVRVQHGRRDALRGSLLEAGIETGIHYYPNHRLTYFRRKGAPLPATDRLYDQLLTLPLHADLREEEQDRVAGALRQFLAAADHAPPASTTA